MALVKRRGSELVVRGRPDYNRVGAVFALLGLLGCAGCLLFDVHAVALLVPGVFLLVGLPFWIMGGTATFDTAKRDLWLFGRRVELAEVAALMLDTSVQIVRSQHGSQKVQRWTLHLTLREEDADAVAQLEILDRKSVV